MIIRWVSHSGGAPYITYAWKGGSAHVFCAEVTEGKTRFFDPQTGKDDASNYIQSMKAGRVGVIRIDNKLVNPKIMGLFITK